MSNETGEVSVTSAELPLPDRRDNRQRTEPRLPGSSFATPALLPDVYIYQPAKAATQSGLAGTREWVLEFAPWSRREIEPLMGWTSSRDPLASLSQLRFPDKQSAIAFAERQGWRYEVRDPPSRHFKPKSYAENLRYDLAGAISRAQRPWNGTTSLARPSQFANRPSRTASGAGETGPTHWQERRARSYSRTSQ